jgi:ubiquinone/menaquinone biosynthesis C-methylase UbiE
MSEMRRQYQDSTKMTARAMIHIKYGPPGKTWSLADTGLITAGAQLLDIGCGPGRFWASNASILPPDIQLTLADLSPGMVGEAVRNIAAADGKYGSVVGKVADVCALPFADGSFDIVTAMHMLYHASDKDRAISEIARALRPDGRLIVTTNGAETMKELKDLSHTVFGRLPYDLGAASFSLENGTPILRKYFQKVEVKELEDFLRVTDAQDIVNYLRSFPPGEDADETMLQNLDKELASRMGAQGGVFPVTRIAGYMVASGPVAKGVGNGVSG